MWRFIQAVVPAAWLLAWSVAAGDNQNRLIQLPVPVVSVSMTPRLPTIDGKIDENEWRYASKVTGFLNLADGLVADEQTVVYITFDKDRLYLAFDCLLSTERSPAATESRRDGGVWGDESIEVFLLPPGREESQFYHFIGNSIGTIYDDYARDKGWNGNWEFANDSGMGFWHAELSIPFSDLGATAPTGQTWRVNFARNLGKNTSWSYTGKGYMNPQRFGVARFTQTAMIPQIHSIEGLATGLVNVAGSGLNPDEKQARGMLGIRLSDLDTGIKEGPTEGVSKWSPRRQFNLIRNEKSDFSMSCSAQTEGPKLLRIAIIDEQGETLLFSAIPFVASAPKYVEFLSEPSEQNLYVRMDLRGLGRDEPIDVRIHIESEDGRFSQQIAFDRMSAGKTYTRKTDIRDWPVGRCRCRVVLCKSGTAKPLHEADVFYERRKPPEWYVVGRDLGVSDKVPRPWTPVVLEGDTVKVWGREYLFGRELLLEQAAASGQALLSGPVLLEGAIGGKTYRAMLLSRRDATTRPDIVIRSSQGTLGALKVGVEASVEYDGMIKFQLNLAPDAPIEMEKLRLIVPFTKQRSLYCHYASSYYGKGWSGSLPQEGLQITFHPFVWLGDNERGLMWFAESTQGWNCGKTPIEIRPAGESNKLTVHFMEEAERLEGPRTITFGLQATPVRPVPPDWRAWRADRIYVRASKKETYYVDWEAEGLPLQWRCLWWTDGMRRIFSPGHTTPLQIMPELARYVAPVHEKGTRIVTYFYLHGVNRIATDFDRYYPIWQTSPHREMAYWGCIIMGACPAAEEFADYLLYGIEKMVQTYHVDGVYFDGAAPPVPCTNELHGHGWVDKDGIRQPVYPIFGLREFYKRLWTILCEHVDNPIIWIHSDGKIAPPVMSFVTANYEGECVQGQLKRGDTYLSDILSLDFCRSHLMATQWGIVPMWLPSVFGTEEQRARQGQDMLALLLIHGTPLALTGRIDRDLVRKIWKAQAEFNIGQATFHGYWEDTIPVKMASSAERFHVSCYEKDGRLMIVASNFATEPQTVSLDLDAGLSKGITSFHDCVSDNVAQCKGGRIAVTVQAHSFRLLVSDKPDGK